MLSPTLGLLVWFLVLLLLLRYDGVGRGSTSPALWLPLAWIFFSGSRLPAQWLGITSPSMATAFEEGSPLDRTILFLLIVLALWVVARRRISWSALFRQNLALASLLLFALASVVWSDFPFITFKRWVRDLGTYVMILIVLSERHPLEAVSIVLRRLSYLLLIASTILIKYYPELGVLYNPWTGAPEYTGASTSKNMLGAICLIAALYLVWDTVDRWPERKTRAITRRLVVNGLMILTALWLMNLSNSATSRVCLVLGCLIILLAHTKLAKANPRRILIAIPAALVSYVVVDFFVDVSSLVAELLGRDPSLTGRRGIWSAVLAQQTNPLLGVGYQTFWLGQRLLGVFKTLDTAFIINEAHNGYLEVYLNLGLIGLALIVLVIATSYRTLWLQTVTSPRFASFSLAFWSIMLVYNITEAAFVGSLPWSVFLLLTVVVPGAKAESPVPSAAVWRPRGVALVRQVRQRDV